MNSVMNCKPIVVLVTLLALTACGGGGGSTEPGPETRVDCFADAVTRLVNNNPVAEALYCNDGADWNDYVINDSVELFDLSDTACTGTEPGGYNACLHGGELRMVIVENKTQCTGLSASDALGAFNWSCDESTNPVRMYSIGLRTNKSLSDLVDFNTFDWRTNSVTVFDGGIPSFTTDSTIWWGNPVVASNNGGNFSTPSIVHLVTNGTGSYVLGANKIALAVQPGMTLIGPATASNAITASNRDFLWIEGAIDASSDLHGLLLQNTRFSSLRNLSVKNANDSGAQLNGVSKNIIAELTASNNGSHGINIDQASSDNTFTDLTSDNNSGEGLFLSANTANNSFTDTTVISNTNNGVRLSSSGNNTFTRLSSADNGGSGLLLQNGSNLNRFTDLVITNNGFNNGNYGISFNGTSSTGNLFNNSVVASNESFGIFNPHADNVFTNINVASNGSGGILLNAGGNSVFMNTVVAANSGDNIEINSGNSSFLNMVSAHAGGDGLVATNGLLGNTFYGLLKLGSNNSFDCFIIADLVCPPSDGTTTGISLASSFVGKVVTDDTVNQIDSFGSAPYANIITPDDWTFFDNAYRAWGWDNGGTFPHAGAVEAPCAPTRTCNIWDWTLASADTVVKGVVAQPTNGNAANTLTHVWSVTVVNQADCDAVMPGSVINGSQCESTFLRNAVERLDGIGNNNGLCESNETCIYTPNIGAYQGGTGFLTLTFNDGDTLAGITLLKRLTFITP